MKTQTAIPSADLALFCSQIGMLLRSAIPMDDGLRAIGETLSGQGRQLLTQLETEYSSTYSLSEALEKSGAFPDYLVKMVGIGERSGKLEEVMDALTRHYERDSRMKDQLRHSVRQPIVSVCAMTIVVVVLVWKVLPLFREVLSSLGSVSGAVSSMVNIGTWVGVAVLALLALLLAGTAVGALFLRLGKGGWITRLFSKIKPVRRTMEKLSAARFASVMAMLLSSGYQLEEALEFAAGILPDAGSALKVRRIKKRMEEGEAFPKAVQEEGIFPGLYSRMVEIGFRTGALDTVLEKLAGVYEEEANDAVQSLLGTIEPLLVGFLAVSVGAILFSVMLPLLGVMSSIG